MVEALAGKTNEIMRINVGDLDVNVLGRAEIESHKFKKCLECSQVDHLGFTAQYSNQYLIAA